MAQDFERVLKTSIGTSATEIRAAANSDDAIIGMRFANKSTSSVTVDATVKNSSTSYYLIKEFKFTNFKKSQSFINKVGDIAEHENHHPDIIFGWGYAKIKIFTHAISGLAESDFILASKIDKIVNG